MTTNGRILITGCSTGIGRAAAFGLAKKGFNVIAATRTQLQADELTKAGLTTVVIDNDDPVSIAKGWNHALQLAGANGIFGLFANAGFGLAGALEDVTWKALEAQLRTNVLGTHELVRIAVKHMNENRGGRIVICSSVVGFVGMPLRGAYVASKYALEGLADVWRLELRESNVKVCLLEPGPVMTNFRSNSLKALRHHIDSRSSKYKTAYAKLEDRLGKPGPAVPFTGQADQCIPLLTHAFTAHTPKNRYRWTVHTVVFSFFKRIFPSKILDFLLSKA